MSKYQFKASEIYIPNTNIAKNKLDIEDEALIAEIEANLLESAYGLFVGELSSSTQFDELYFINLHRRTFESLYDWAGVYRIEDMSKGGSLFCLGVHLPKQMQRFFSELAQENYLQNSSLTDSEFASRLAYYQCELITLHPFYELNGRITRLFFDLIAIAKGYHPIDYSGVFHDDSEMNDYIKASVVCVQQAECLLLEQLIFAGLNKRDGLI